MTDQLTGIGSETSGNPADGNGGGANGSGAAPGTPIAPSPEQGQLDWAKAKGWVNEDGSIKSPEVLKGYQALEKQLGSMIRPLDDKSSAEDRDNFAKRMGWPGDVSKYEIKADNLPPDLQYDPKLADAFKGWANDARLPAATAQTLHDSFVKFAHEKQNADIAAFAADVVKAAQTAHGDIVKAWGDPATETYRVNTEAARRALANDPMLKGFGDALKQAGMMTPDGYYANPAVAHLLAQAGRQYMNDRFVSPNSGGQPGGNPFVRALPDGKPNPEFNLTRQAALLKQNPDQARALIAAAGQSPAEYGL